MQKKLLLMFMVVNCTMLQADGLQDALSGDGHKKESAEIAKNILDAAQAFVEQDAILEKAKAMNREIPDHEKEQYALYAKALADVVSQNNPQAIENLFAANKNAYETQQKKDTDEQDDGQPGYRATPPTPQSRNGMIRHYYEKRGASKAKINEKLKKQFDGHVATFNSEIMPALGNEIAYKIDEMEKTFLLHLTRCGADQECLGAVNVHPLVIMKEGYFDQFYSKGIDFVIKTAHEKGIPLTNKEITAIAATIKFQRDERDISFQAFEISKKNVLDKLHELFSKKNDEIIDELKVNEGSTEDQNDLSGSLT